MDISAHESEQRPFSPTFAYVALGSNQGDSVEILRSAIARLGKFSDAPVTASSFWLTEPVDCPPGSPPFVNAVVRMAAGPDETPETLLEKLQAIERAFGRRPRRVVNEARPLDLDLIAFGDERRDAPALVLPHPRAHQRRFVLAPLGEIAPDLILPGRRRTVAQWLAALGDSQPARNIGR